MEKRTRDWLENNLGTFLTFTLNGQLGEGYLTYDPGMGEYFLPFFGGQVNAEICEIAVADGVFGGPAPEPRNA